MKTVSPYSKLAFIYDRLMDHVDYQSWCQYLLALMHRSGKHINSIVDLACGTGTMLEELRYHVSYLIGCDQSEQMIRLAENKLMHKDVSLLLNNLSDIALTNNVLEGVILMYDSLNYIFNKQNLEKTFQEINRILKKGGVFIFDVVSEEHCLEHYSDYLESEYWAKDGYSRHSYYDSKNKIQTNQFRIVINGKTFIENHLQRIYPIEYLKSELYKHNFDVLGLFDDFTFNHSIKEAGRIHFLNIKR